LVLAVLLVAQTGQPASAPLDPLARLQEALADPGGIETVLVVLQSTGDEDLRPLFEASCRSGAESTRSLALAALAETCKERAADVLKDRLANDPSKAVRLKAAIALFGSDLLSADEMRGLLGSQHEELQCLAADALVRQGQGRTVQPLLEKLAGSESQATACSARLDLLALGDKGQLDELQRLVRDRGSDQRVVLQVLSQISDEKVLAAAPLAVEAADSDWPREVKLRAYWAVAAVCPDASGIIHRAIRRSDQIVMKVNLIRILASCPFPAEQLKDLAKDDDPPGLVARFELARQAGAKALDWAAGNAIQQPHPVVVEYILSRAGEDVEAAGQTARSYQAPLLNYIRSRKPSSQMSAEHYQLAKAATVLADLGGEGAIDGLREVLSGPYNTKVRAVAAGLLRSKNPAVCDLALPLLESPYPELSSDAALVLGRFGRAEAAEKLRQLARRSQGAPQAMEVLACWYLLKVSGGARSAAEALARQVEQPPSPG